VLFTTGKQVKQSHYRPWQALRFPRGWGSQILWQSAHEGGKVVSPTHRPPLPQVIFLVLISVRGWVEPRAIVRPEGLCQRKNPVISSGIERATFRFVAQCLKHCATACPIYNRYWSVYMSMDTVLKGKCCKLKHETYFFSLFSDVVKDIHKSVHSLVAFNRLVYFEWLLRSPRTTSLDTTRPSTIFYRLLLNWASLRRHYERSLKMAM
jgi:hypothetical protein